MANMVVRTNVFSLNAHRNMKNVGLQQRQASNRLSSGYRINSAADDAAGLAISENMRAQIRGLDQASRNTQDGQAMLLVTEGGMQEMTNILQRVRELAVQASNDTNNESQRHMIQAEVRQLHTELVDMRARVQFNTIDVLNTTENGKAWFQVGPNEGQNIRYDFKDANIAAKSAASAASIVASALTEEGLQGGVAISSFISNVGEALDTLNTERANIGAIMNRMDFTMRALDISSENMSDAESRVRNADMAREMMRFTMTNVLQQAATAMLAQANQLPNNLLQLLR